MSINVAESHDLMGQRLGFCPKIVTPTLSPAMHKNGTTCQEPMHPVFLLIFGRTWADFGLFAAFALSSDYCFWSFFDHNDKSSVATHPMDQVDPVKSQNGLFETL